MSTPRRPDNRTDLERLTAVEVLLDAVKADTAETRKTFYEFKEQATLYRQQGQQQLVAVQEKLLDVQKSQDRLSATLKEVKATQDRERLNGELPKLKRLANSADSIIATITRIEYILPTLEHIASGDINRDIAHRYFANSNFVRFFRSKITIFVLSTIFGAVVYEVLRIIVQGAGK